MARRSSLPAYADALHKRPPRATPTPYPLDGASWRPVTQTVVRMWRNGKLNGHENGIPMSRVAELTALRHGIAGTHQDPSSRADSSATRDIALENLNFRSKSTSTSATVQSASAPLLQNSTAAEASSAYYTLSYEVPLGPSAPAFSTRSARRRRKVISRSGATRAGGALLLVDWR